LRNEKWTSFLRTLRPQSSQFWKIARYLKKSSVAIPPLTHRVTQVVYTPHKVEILARQFEQSHNLTTHMGSCNHSQTVSRHVNRFFRTKTPHIPQLQLTNPYEVRRKIFLLKPRATPDEDGITSVMLRYLSKKALIFLTRIFNHLLRTSHFLSAWKRATIIPIPKPNKPPSDLSSYRPISLLSIVIKLFERIIANRLVTYVSQQRLLPNEQFGFRKKHSTVSQLVRISDYITNRYNLHKHTGMVSLDIEKAYDTVWINGLLYKLISFKLPTYLIFILRAFLTDRSFTVRLTDAFSIPKPTQSDLPQGAVLSTTLFAIYISDMPHSPTPN
jgi:hypothetical protein